MATVRIYGSSDDLIEIEPIGVPMSSVPGCDEYNFEQAEFVLKGERVEGFVQRQSNVLVTYGEQSGLGGGCWGIEVRQVEEDVPLVPCSIKSHDNGYSAEATFLNVVSVERVI